MKHCLKCGETSEDQFDACWNCGADLIEGTAPTAKVKHLGRRRDRNKKNGQNKSIGNVLSKSLREEIDDLSRKPPTGIWSGRFVISALVIFIVIFILGIFHIVTGTKHVSGIDGIELIKRESFGYSEIYIDADAIVRMPPLVAIISHPVGYRVVASITGNKQYVHD